MEVKELELLVEQKHGEIAHLLRQATKDGKVQFGHAELEEFRARNDELNELVKLLQTERAREQTNADVQETPQRLPAVKTMASEPQTLWQAAVKAGIMEKFKDMRSVSVEVPIHPLDFLSKQLTRTQFPPESVRSGRIVEAVLPPVTVVDLPMQTTTTQAAVKWMQESAITVSAAEVAEGAQYPSQTFQLSEQSATVQKIGDMLKVSDEALADMPRLDAYLEARLPEMIRQRLDNQILNGNGTAPNLRGILNTTGIQTQARGTDPHFDAIAKAITLVMTNGGAVPDFIVMHPSDWDDFRLAKTADGIYLLGNPGTEIQPRLFGLPVVMSNRLAVGTAIVGSWRMYSELAWRMGIEVEMTNSNEDDFTKGLVAIRATARVAFCVYRPAAFCSVTGL